MTTSGSTVLSGMRPGHGWLRSRRPLPVVGEAGEAGEDAVAAEAAPGAAVEGGAAMLR